VAYIEQQLLQGCRLAFYSDSFDFEAGAFIKCWQNSGCSAFVYTEELELQGPREDEHVKMVFLLLLCRYM
jgi:hypothetical protein